VHNIHKRYRYIKDYEPKTSKSRPRQPSATRPLQESAQQWANTNLYEPRSRPSFVPGRNPSLSSYLCFSLSRNVGCSLAEMNLQSLIIRPIGFFPLSIYISLASFSTRRVCVCELLEWSARLPQDQFLTAAGL